MLICLDPWIYYIGETYNMTTCREVSSSDGMSVANPSPWARPQACEARGLSYYYPVPLQAKIHEGTHSETSWRADHLTSRYKSPRYMRAEEYIGPFVWINRTKLWNRVMFSRKWSIWLANRSGHLDIAYARDNREQIRWVRRSSYSENCQSSMLAAWLVHTDDRVLCRGRNATTKCKGVLPLFKFCSFDLPDETDSPVGCCCPGLWLAG